MEIEELQKIRDKMVLERDIASQKLDEIKKLHKICEEEYNARNGFIFQIDRLIELKK